MALGREARLFVWQWGTVTTTWILRRNEFKENFLKWMVPFISSREIRVSMSSSLSPSPLRSRSRVTKNLAVLKKAMTRKTRAGHQDDGMRRQAGCTPLLMMGVKVLRTSGRSQHPGEVERSLSHSGRTGDAGKGQKKGTWVKSCKERTKHIRAVLNRTESNNWRVRYGKRWKIVFSPGSRKGGD